MPLVQYDDVTELAQRQRPDGMVTYADADATNKRIPPGPCAARTMPEPTARSAAARRSPVARTLPWSGPVS